jgi:holo-[acyl-carrier protein] synthase
VIAGIGVDVCEVDRIRRALEASHGARFRDRVFTDAEQAYCEGRRRGRFESYAARFAAKEAAMKVLGTGWGRGVGWRDVEVARERGAAPAIRLHGQAAIIARRLGMSRWLVTLTHTRTSALAWVVAERGRVSGSGRPRAARRGAGAGAGARRRPRGRR